MTEEARREHVGAWRDGSCLVSVPLDVDVDERSVHSEEGGSGDVVEEFAGCVGLDERKKGLNAKAVVWDVVADDVLQELWW